MGEILISDETAESGNALIMVQNRTLYAGQYKESRIDAIRYETVIMTFSGAESDMTHNGDFILIYDITREMVIYPDFSGNIVICPAWVSDLPNSDGNLIWDDRNESDILVPAGQTWTRDAIANKLDDVYCSDNAAEIMQNFEIAAYVAEFLKSATIHTD